MKDRGRQIGAALAALARQRWWVLAAVVIVAVVLGIGIVLSFDLARQTQELVNGANAIPADQIPPKDRVDLLRSAFQYQADNLAKLWTGIIGIFTGIAAVAAGVIAWRNLRATQAKLEVDREAQITNRFTQAIGQLGAELKDGKPNLEVRLGGIYALERIARDSPRDHWTIMEVLTAYVRQNARWTHVAIPEPIIWWDRPELQPQLRTDIQAILTVLGRRNNLREPRGLDLRDTDLHLANLEEARLDGADLRGAHLEGANLARAHLEATDLTHAHLWWATLTEAQLTQARLAGAQMKGANLMGANLERATLYGAWLGGAYLKEARLEGTDLEDADLSTSASLTDKQIKSASERSGARLPPELAYLEEPPKEGLVELEVASWERLADETPPTGQSL